MIPAPICRECREGKHRNCDGIALDEASDDFVECRCPPAFGHTPREVLTVDPADANPTAGTP